jgi:hypothetical protein
MALMSITMSAYQSGNVPLPWFPGFAGDWPVGDCREGIGW